MVEPVEQNVGQESNQFIWSLLNLEMISEISLRPGSELSQERGRKGMHYTIPMPPEVRNILGHLSKTFEKVKEDLI